jgi:UDP-N-acetylglucosamine acyltransferase
MSIHSTAIIDASAKIGKNVSVGPYSVIGPETTIGDNCRIASHAVIEYTELGPDCIVFPFVSLGLEPQHMGYKGEKTKLVIGPRCQFRESVTVHRGTMFDAGVTTIGSDGYFMALSHIAHDCRIGNRVIMANGAQLAGHVKIGNNAFISTTVGIHQFTRIGDGAMISGGAMVPLDVAPFCIAQGDRASIRGLNIVGMRRAGLKKENIRAVKSAYETVFLSQLTLDEALEKMKALTDDPYAAIFHAFFLEKKRGFLRPSLQTTQEETVTS